jgi:hypothetical protein
MSLDAFDTLIDRHSGEAPKIGRILAGLLAVADRNQGVVFVPAVAKLANEDLNEVRYVLTELNQLGALHRKLRVRCPNTHDGIEEFDSEPTLPVRVDCIHHPICPDISHEFADESAFEVFFLITPEVKKNFKNMLSKLYGNLEKLTRL